MKGTLIFCVCCYLIKVVTIIVNNSIKRFRLLFQDSDCESSLGSPEPGSLVMGSDTGTDLTMSSKHLHSRMEELSPAEQKTSISPSITPQSHLNGASKCYLCINVQILSN